MMSVLIGGGSGFIGRHLTKLLEKNGMSVTWVSRSPGPNRITWDDLQRDGLPTDCTAVVSLSGAKILNPFKRWGSRLRKEVRSSRVDCTKALAVAMFRANANPFGHMTKSTSPPKVFVTYSSVAYYQPDPVMAYDEFSPGGDFDYWSRLCADWEEVAEPLKKLEDVRLVNIRSGTVLGQDGGIIPQLFLPFYCGLGAHFGTGEQWFPWIHIDDAVGLIQYAMQHQHVRGVLNGVSPQPVTNAKFTQQFADALGRPTFLRVPATAVKAAYGEERAALILDGQQVVPRRTLEVGYQFAFSSLASACRTLNKMYG